MKFKNTLFNFCRFKNKKNKIESDNSYCYSNIIWNNQYNLIILLSYTEDYFEQIIELQDAISHTYLWEDGLSSKNVFSSYDEDVTKKDENGNDITTIIIHKKYYMLIGGDLESWNDLYKNISNLNNKVLNIITNEIINNCDAFYFKNLINDGIMPNFYKDCEMNYDAPSKTTNKYLYTNPKVIMERLPNGFTGRDILKFIKIYDRNKFVYTDALVNINSIKNMDSDLFVMHYTYPIYEALFTNPTIEKLKLLLEPVYKQPDDDSIPGDISDESLDEIFRTHYEKFTAIKDDYIQYEDIDEIIEEDNYNTYERSDLDDN